MLENLGAGDLIYLNDEASEENMKGYLEFAIVYDAAIKIVKTKLDIFEKEYNLLYGYNPIHTVYSRVKSPVSISEKLKRRGYPVSIASAKRNLKDIAGVRIICDYISEVKKVGEVLKKQEDLQLIEEKDYIAHPKKNGYRSLHLVFLVSVRMTEKTEIVPVEIQIRTIAMDFWASLEHKLRYKKDKDMSFNLKVRLKACAEISNKLDEEMESIERQMNDIK